LLADGADIVVGQQRLNPRASPPPCSTPGRCPTPATIGAC